MSYNNYGNRSRSRSRQYNQGYGRRSIIPQLDAWRDAVSQFARQHRVSAAIAAQELSRNWSTNRPRRSRSPRSRRQTQGYQGYGQTQGYRQGYQGYGQSQGYGQNRGYGRRNYEQQYQQNVFDEEEVSLFDIDEEEYDRNVSLFADFLGNQIHQYKQMDPSELSMMQAVLAGFTAEDYRNRVNEYAEELLQEMQQKYKQENQNINRTRTTNRNRNINRNTNQSDKYVCTGGICKLKQN